MKLRLLKPHDYNNKHYNAGEIIETATDEMGNYLIRLGVAEEISHYVSGYVNVKKEMLKDISEMEAQQFETEKEQITRTKEKAEFTPFPEKKRGRPKKNK